MAESSDLQHWIILCAWTIGIELPIFAAKMSAAEKNFEALRLIGEKLARQQLPLWRRPFRRDIGLASTLFAFQEASRSGIPGISPPAWMVAGTRDLRRAQALAGKARRIFDGIAGFAADRTVSERPADQGIPPAPHSSTMAAKSLSPFPFDRQRFWNPPASLRACWPPC